MNIYGKLTFNGYTFPNYEIVSVGKSESNLFAISRSMNTEESVGAIPLFVDFKYDNPTLSFDLIKVDNNRNPLSFSRNETFDLQRRLYSRQEIGVLQIKEKNNLLFYGAFVGTPKETFLGKTQYLSFEFQLISPYCYSSIILDNYKIVGEKSIEIFNESNAREKIKPDIEIEMLEGNNIEIINETTGEKTFIYDMEDLEKVHIFGETLEFVSNVDSGRNIFRLSSKNVVGLVYGKNSIKIKADKANIKFIYQYELLLY